MNAKKIFLCILAPFIVVGCKKTPFFYRPITESEIAGVQAIWEDRDLKARNVGIIEESKYANYRVIVFTYEISGSTRFGLVAIPDMAGKTELPVALINYDFILRNQKYSPKNVIKWAGTDMFGVPSPLKGFLLVFPAYRGQTLNFDGRIVKAEGDVFDAFDGAADDAISILNVAEEYVPEGQYEKIFVMGHGRGGSVSLLLASRDSRINTVFATAASVNFYKYEVQDLYSDEFYKYLFKNNSGMESRKRILASSPVYWPVLANVKNMYLIYGAEDMAVPIWNMGEIFTHLSNQKARTYVNVIKGTNHFTLEDHYEYSRDLRKAVRQFLINKAK